jgi:ABC-type dipeptide/oligopeptide/nickel transport system permease subunit
MTLAYGFLDLLFDLALGVGIIAIAFVLFLGLFLGCVAAAESFRGRR